MLRGDNIPQAEIEDILADLNFIYDQDIRVIYSLTNSHDPRNAELIKYLWQHHFIGCTYITQINNISISVQDFMPPTQQQLHLITNDAIERLMHGENLLIHCAHGIGRTGSLLAAIYMQVFNIHNAQQAIDYIRAEYLAKAVETLGQVEALENFAKEYS